MNYVRNMIIVACDLKNLNCNVLRNVGKDRDVLGLEFVLSLSISINLTSPFCQLSVLNECDDVIDYRQWKMRRKRRNEFNARGSKWQCRKLSLIFAIWFLFWFPMKAFLLPFFQKILIRLKNKELLVTNFHSYCSLNSFFNEAD